MSGTKKISKEDSHLISVEDWSAAMADLNSTKVTSQRFTIGRVTIVLHHRHPSDMVYDARIKWPTPPRQLKYKARPQGRDDGGVWRDGASISADSSLHDDRLALNDSRQIVDFLIRFSNHQEIHGLTIYFPERQERLHVWRHDRKHFGYTVEKDAP